jgi:uncharacterized protein (TIGR02271 family)
MNTKKKTENPNRDPITCEPGSHPVATGSGALAGGAAGAAAGAAAGPIGAGVGAAAGAVVGGLGGKAVGEKFNPTHSSELGRFIDFTVVDQDGDKVGTVDAVWEDDSGQPYYLAVRTGWLGLGKAHVVPADSAQVDERARKIRLPYNAELMKNAPSFDCAEDMNDDSHRTIRDYFGLRKNTRAKDTRRDTPRADTTGATQDETTMRLKQEEVKIGKREVEYGGIRLRKIIRTETVNQPVELKREEIVIERTPVNEGASNVADADFDEREVYIPLRREEPVVEKTVRANEEVRVGKRTDIDHQQVSETFRREDVEIANEGEVRNQPRRT